MNGLAILGASGHGKVVAEIAQLTGWEEICFFDDAWPRKVNIGSWPVHGTTWNLLDALPKYDGVIIAIGDNALRWTKQEKLAYHGASLTTLVHPSSVISRGATLGPGTVVMAGAVVNVDTAVGPCAILNTGCTLDHDCRLDYAVHVSPGANLAGNVSVGPCSWIGLGASAIQGVSIGANVIIGAGAVVINDIPGGVTAKGVPAYYQR